MKTYVTLRKRDFRKGFHVACVHLCVCVCMCVCVCVCLCVCLSVCLTAVKEKQCIPGYRMFPKLAIGVPGKPGTSMRLLWELGEVRATNKSLKDKLAFFTL